MTRPLAVLAGVAFAFALVLSALALAWPEPKGADDVYRVRTICEAVCR